jgi:hypothetical protein
MSSNSFDLITQELLKQQQIMKILQAENRELRQQLTDLRNGRGIFIEIHGKRFALNASFISEDSGIQSSSSVTQEVSPVVAEEVTTAISKVFLTETAKNASPSQNNKQPEIRSSTTFLEEAMISEFASAMDSPLTLLQDPPNQQKRYKQEKREEEQMAVLRRDLMGSYLLD